MTAAHESLWGYIHDLYARMASASAAGKHAVVEIETNDGRTLEPKAVQAYPPFLVCDLAQEDADPAVGKITLKAAGQKLKTGLHDLKALAKALEKPTPHLARVVSGTQWRLVLDHEEPEGLAQRPHLRDSSGRLTGTIPRLAASLAAKPLSEVLIPLQLEPLTMVDQPSFVDHLQR